MQKKINFLSCRPCKIPSRSVSDRPKRSTDQAATMSNFFALSPTMPAPSEAKSDGLTHPGRGTLKWQIAARPLTVC
jgi:hypothetical protein